MRFVIQNKEVYNVMYYIDAENQEEAEEKFIDGEGEQIDLTYSGELSDYVETNTIFQEMPIN